MSPLLRVSGFCRQSSSVHNNKNIKSSYSVRMVVMMIPAMLSTNSNSTTATTATHEIDMHQHQHSSSNAAADCCCSSSSNDNSLIQTTFVSVRVLQRLCLFAGSLVRLRCVSCGHRSSNASPNTGTRTAKSQSSSSSTRHTTVTTRLAAVHRAENQPFESHTCITSMGENEHDNDDNDEDDDDDDEQLLTIYINAVTAINLNLDVHNFWDNEPVVVEGTLTPVLSPDASSSPLPPPAEAVTLRLLARPLMPPSLVPLWKQRQKDSSSEQQQQETLPLPPAETLLQRSHIVVVLHKSELYFYQIVQIHGTEESIEDHTINKVEQQQQQQQVATWRGTSNTRYSIALNPSTFSCPRLPPFIPTRHLLFTSSDSETTLATVEPPHPNLATLVNAVHYVPVTATPAERVLHLIGTERDHRVITLVETAAARAGRRCVSVSGLAFAAYWRSPSSTTTTTTITTNRRNPTGSLYDKLLGLEIVLQEAAQHAPSILLLQDIDKELSFHDKPVREDEESRIWSLLMEYLSMKQNDTFLLQDYDTCQVPAVLVIVTSSKPLIAGPISQGMVFTSIQCSLPDKAYLHYIWNKEKNNPALPEFSKVEHLLIGRGAGEVTNLREEFLAELSSEDNNCSSSSSSSSSPISILEALCRQRDEARRKKSGATRIPSVKWQDVGGLLHVRQEIMDAIELPLQYPHLFPESSRSGILLYGPPGCGKTLVAKAVATECQLPFCSIKGPELLGSFVGESEAHVREVFEQARELARKNKPPACILFFDELDSLAPRRGEQASGGNVMDRVVATFFTELDKHSSDCTVFVMGATNRPDLLDPSLLRPGRLDRLVYLGVSPTDRARILAAQIRKLRLDGDPVALAEAAVSHLPENLTGADLSTVASGAQLRAIERLCLEADAEMNQLKEEGHDDVTIDSVLEAWDENRLKPIVTLDDILKASEAIVPSVSAIELGRYEGLKDQFFR